MQINLNGDLGSYPFFRLGKFGVGLVIRATDRAATGRTAEGLREPLIGLGGEILEDTSG